MFWRAWLIELIGYLQRKSLEQKNAPGFCLIDCSNRRDALPLLLADSADAPNASCNFHQILDMQGVAQQPSEDCAATSTKPESTGEFSPTISGEKVGRRILYRDI